MGCHQSARGHRHGSRCRHLLRLAIQALTDLGLAETAGQLGGALLIRAALSGSPLASDLREEVQAFIIDLAERAARSPAD